MILGKEVSGYIVNDILGLLCPSLIGEEGVLVFKNVLAEAVAELSHAVVSFQFHAQCTKEPCIDPVLYCLSVLPSRGI